MTLPKNPLTIPQNAPSAVIDLLQILINPTGPQDDAKTVPINSISQKTLGGKIKHNTSTTMPVTHMAIRDALTVNCFLRTTISLLTLKPMRDKNVDAEDSDVEHFSHDDEEDGEENNAVANNTDTDADGK